MQGLGFRAALVRCNVRGESGPLVTKARHRLQRGVAIMARRGFSKWMLRLSGVLGAAIVVFFCSVFAISEWKMRRAYDAPLVPLAWQGVPDPARGLHMAKVAGCWAGCHGTRGEGGEEAIDGIHRRTAPTLSDVLPQYTDEELVRLIRYGVKRDGHSAIGMISYTFWPLGDEDLAHIIAHLRAQPDSPPVPREATMEFTGRLALVTGEWGVSATQVDRTIPRWGNLPRTTAFERGRYLASITCAECHGLDFRGNPVEGGPSLAVVAAYPPELFRHLIQTGKPLDGRDIPAMSWMPDVDFSDEEISDLYRFLRQYHGLP